MNNFSLKPKTSGKLKAKQYGAAACICFLIAGILFAVRFFWGRMLLGLGNEQVSLEMLIPMACNLVLIFGAVDLAAAMYHFVLWKKNGREPMDDDNAGIFSDWKSGERSPVKVTLALLACMAVLALVIIWQG